jgi:hypothetical protein
VAVSGDKVGVAVGVGEAVGEAEAVGDAEAVGEAVGVAETVGEAVGVAETVGEAVGVAVTVGEAFGVAVITGVVPVATGGNSTRKVGRGEGVRLAGLGQPHTTATPEKINNPDQNCFSACTVTPLLGNPAEKHIPNAPLSQREKARMIE